MSPLNARLHQYKAVMTECKFRLESIHILLSRQSGLPAQIVAEMCYLQLRMLCESIAIGCLILHGDIPAARSKRLLKVWEADKIMRELAALHPSFYPEPAVVKKEQWGVNLSPKAATTWLTQAELPMLYQKCNERLHRGTLKRFLSNKQMNEMKAVEIGSWQKKIFQVLDVHIISSFTPGAVYLVAMNPSMLYLTNQPGRTR